MRFSRGKIWFEDSGPCKRFDILQLCLDPHPPFGKRPDLLCFFSTSLSQNNEWAYLVERGVEEKFFIVHIKL